MVGNGDCYAELTSAAAGDLGTLYRTRLRLDATEYRGDDALITSLDVCEPFAMGMAALPRAKPGTSCSAVVTASRSVGSP